MKLPPPLAKLAEPVLALPRAAKRITVLAIDLGLCVVTVWLAFYLRLGEFVSFRGDSDWSAGAQQAAAVSIGLALPLFTVSGLYRAIFRYSGWPAMSTVARVVAVYGLFYACIFTAVGAQGVPRTVGILQPILLLLAVGASRALARAWLGDHYQSILRRASRPKVLIYGAGHTGRQLAAAMAHSPELQLAGFLDDDALLHGRVLNGQPIHDPAALDTLVRTLNVRHVLLAMPNLPRGRRRLILGRIRSANVAVRTLPSMTDLAQGRVTIAGLRELDVDDLLGREPVPPDPVLMARSITSKNVLVTGAGGSIGSELCRQILQGSPARLILVDQNEFALYRIHQELEEPLATPLNRSAPALVALLASVQDRTRMDQIMSEWRPHTVYHAAAYKHVPLVEQNLVAGLANNVLGSLHTAQAAIASKVRDFVLVSTDKAVRPTSVMGASKRLAEMILQALAAEQGQTRFSMVRFGNVLGSSGSVVPRFRKQIRDGGPITLTHPEVTRFFMTIPEAAQLVIQAGAMAEGGDVFVLDMGEPVRVMELARRVVELSGLTVKDAHLPEGNIAIEITGLRPGEKLYEELLTEHNAEATAHPRILRAQEDFIGWEKLAAELEALACALSRNDAEAILGLLCALVPHYTPATAISNPADRVQGSESEPPNATSSTLEHLCENRHESVLPTG